MKRFSIISTVIALATIISGAASAADLAARPYTKAPMVAPAAVYDWSGFYIGAHVGGGWASNDWFEDQTQTGAGGFGPVGFRDASFNASGVIGGGQVGFNYQSGWAVFGVEGDVSGSGLKGNASCFSELPQFIETCSANIKWMASITGRFGVALDRTLLYVKGGYAWANEDLSNFCNICNFGAPVTWHSSDNRSGGTVGVGVEYGFAPNWSAKVEYDYIAFGTRNGSFTNAPGVFPYTEDLRQNLSLVKVGVNYRFGGFAGSPVVARY